MKLSSAVCSGQQQSAPNRAVQPFFSPKSPSSRHAKSLQAHGLKGQSYNVEIECDENEDPEGVFKRFRNSCNQSGMVYEARKRQYFENKQDIIKRKQQEKGMRKQRAIRERYLQTYGDAHSDTPPFSDLFQGQDDIYDIIGSMSDSYDEDRSMYSRRQARANGAPRNSLAKSEDTKEEEPAAPAVEQPVSDSNTIRRSIASSGPVISESNGANEEPKQKQKAKFQTAKSRRAEKLRTPAKV